MGLMFSQGVKFFKAVEVGYVVGCEVCYNIFIISGFRITIGAMLCATPADLENTPASLVPRADTSMLSVRR